MSRPLIDQSSEPTTFWLLRWQRPDGDSSLGGALTQPPATCCALLVALIVGWGMPALGADPVLNRVARAIGVWLLTLLAAVRVFRHPLAQLARREPGGLITATPWGVTLLRAGWTPDRPLPSTLVVPWPIAPAVVMIGLVVMFGREGGEWLAVAVAAVAQGLVLQTAPVAEASRQRWFASLRWIGASVGGYLSVMLQSVWPLTILAMLLVPVAFRIRRLGMRRWWHAESFRMVGAVAIADRSPDMGMTQPDHPALHLWLPRDERWREFERAVVAICAIASMLQVLALAGQGGAEFVTRYVVCLISICLLCQHWGDSLAHYRRSTWKTILKAATVLLAGLLIGAALSVSDAMLLWTVSGLTLVAAAMATVLLPGTGHLQTVLAQHAVSIKTIADNHRLLLDVSQEATDPRAVRRAVWQRERERILARQKASSGGDRRAARIDRPASEALRPTPASPNRVRMAVLGGCGLISGTFWGVPLFAGGESWIVGLPILFGLVGCLVSLIVERSLAPADVRQWRARLGWTGQSGERFAPLALSPRYTAVLLVLAAATATASTVFATAVLLVGTVALVVELSRLLTAIGHTDPRARIVRDLGWAVLLVTAALMWKTTGRWTSLAVFGLIGPVLVALRRPIYRAVIESTIREDLDDLDPAARRLELVDKLHLPAQLAWPWRIEQPLRQNTSAGAVQLLAAVVVVVVVLFPSRSPMVALFPTLFFVVLASGRPFPQSVINPDRPWRPAVNPFKERVPWIAVGVATLVSVALSFTPLGRSPVTLVVSIAACAAVLLRDNVRHQRIATRVAPLLEPDASTTPGPRAPVAST